MSNDFIKRLKRLVAAGRSGNQIADSFGLKKAQVYYLAKKHKIRLRRGFDQALKERRCKTADEFFQRATKSGWSLVRMAESLGVSFGCVQHQYRAYLLSCGVIHDKE